MSKVNTVTGSPFVTLSFISKPFFCFLFLLRKAWEMRRGLRKVPVTCLSLSSSPIAYLSLLSSTVGQDYFMEMKARKDKDGEGVRDG